MAKKGDHHGGAWKVAYADFVTAMMALFMVLWISSQDEEILIATSKYFQNPFNAPMDRSMGVLAGAPKTEKVNPEKDHSLAELALLHQLAQEFYRMLDLDDARKDNPVNVQVTNDGLRITIFNQSDRPIFTRGTAEFTEWGRFVMQNLSWLLARNEFKVRIDGHSASGFTSEKPEYGAWELTTDRAQAARRSLEHYALPAERIERVTGFGDTAPVAGAAPEAAQNDRIELGLVVIDPIKGGSL